MWRGPKVGEPKFNVYKIAPPNENLRQGCQDVTLLTRVHHALTTYCISSSMQIWLVTSWSSLYTNTGRNFSLPN